jgi:hypothetical protein
MRVMSATLLGLLSMQLLNAQMRTNPVWECSDAKGLTAEQMILQLNLGMNRQDHESAKCICDYMESLASAKDQRAITAIAQYLDLPNPLTSTEVGRHLSEMHLEAFGGRYPAQEALLEFHQSAFPVLIQTIQSESTFDQKSENALQVIMWIGAVYPDRTIKMLVDAAAKTTGMESEMLMLAAPKAIAMPECERVRPACENVAIPNEGAVGEN